jgi:hypothetical protein
MRDDREKCYRVKEIIMRRPIAFLAAVTVGMVLVSGAAVAAESMKPTAPEKMMSPAEQQKMHACEQLAAQRNIKMDERAKFLMDCMTGKVK